MTDRPSRSAEEIANILSHGLGLVAAVAATPFLVVTAVRRGDAADVVGSAVFGASLILLYLASTAYHSARADHLRSWLRRLDHAAIYLLIAGTYTPFTLGLLRGPWGWALFGVVWGGAAAGLVFKLTKWGMRHPRVSTAVYVSMGWAVLVAVGPLVRRVPVEGIAWLLAGGVLYTVGVAFYVARRMPFNHLVWHLFVLGGSTCHVVAVAGWAVPG